MSKLGTLFILFFYLFLSISVYSQDSIIEYINTTSDSDSLIIEKCSKYFGKNRYAKHTFPVLKKIKVIAKNNGDKVLISKVFKLKGNYYYYNSKLDSSKIMLDKAKSLLLNKNQPLLLASLNVPLSAVSRKKGDISTAIKLLLESKTMLDKIDTLNTSTIYKKQILDQRIILDNSLANFYNQMEDYQKAISYYDKAYRNIMQLKSFGNAGIILSNKGNLLLKMNNNDEALKVFVKAKILKIEGKLPPSSIANTDENIGLAQLNLNRNNEALLSFDKAMSYYKKVNHLSGLMRTFAEKASTYNALDMYDKAIENGLKAKQLAIENGVLETQEKAYKYLSIAYEAIGDNNNALVNYKSFVKTRDSIFNKKNIKRITQLEMQYKFDKEKELRQIKNQAKEKQSKSTINQLVFGIFSLILISGLLYVLYQTRNKSNIQLIEKNKQISDTLAINETLLKETHHRVKNNLQIISSLLNMQTRYIDDEKSKEIVTDSKNRIKSMSLIHQQLYQESNLTSIESTTYFTKLLDSLTTSYGIDTNSVNMQIDIESILLDIDTAIPLGLILNELISNAFKHGVDKNNGSFSLHFSKKKDYLQLIIKDNGSGIPDDFDIKQTKSYGMKLVQILGQKLKADYTFVNENGLKIIINIHRYIIVT
jgi:two-component sensor histidine kinase